MCFEKTQFYFGSAAVGISSHSDEGAKREAEGGDVHAAKRQRTTSDSVPVADSASATHERYLSFQAWLDGARDDSQSSAMDKAEALRIVQIAAKNHGGIECGLLCLHRVVFLAPIDYHLSCPHWFKSGHATGSLLSCRAPEIERYLAQMQVENKIMVHGNEIYWV